ncbi:MAG: hypothetical protein LBV17_11550 [Treponema sp.]|jgi:hypothetical protein|nr:hypothetical protein [Treponema sp.]
MFVLRFDDGYKIADTVYAYNESFLEGRYPVGENGFWHSGIHVRSKKVYPIMEGFLVAYRISDEYTSIPRLEELSAEQYKKLDFSEQNLYEEFRKKYRLKTPCQYPNKLYSNSFFLIKHKVRLPAMPNRTDPNILEFFTLYTNMAPTPKPPGDYALISKDIFEKELLFYEKYVFKVKEPYFKHKYKEVNNIKIFAGSHCSFSVQDNKINKYICKFINTDIKPINPDKKSEIEVDSKEIESIWSKRRYTPKGNAILAYDSYNNIIARLNNTLEFKQDEISANRKDQTGEYFEITVNERNVNPGDNGKKPINSPTKVYVKIDDLYEGVYGEGRLRVNASILDKEMNGIMIYDEPNTGINARDILGSSSSEFELEDPQEFWTNYNKSDNFFIEIKRSSDEERRKFLCFKKRDDELADQELEVKVCEKDGYEYGKTVICAGSVPGGFEPLDHNTLLGYCAQRFPEYKEFYDLVLFFDRENDKFFNNQALTGYIIPKGTMLYKKQTINNKIQFSPDNEKSKEEITVLEYESLKETGTAAQTEYCRFYHNGKIQYLPLSQLENFKKGNILDWNEEFIKLGVITDNDKIMNEISKLIVEYYKARNITEIWTVIEANFTNIKTQELALIRREKRKLVCRHPLEWDKTLYENNTVPWWLRVNRNDKQFSEEIEAVEIWNGLSGKTIEGLDLSKNDFVFAHPVYFADYLDREGILTRQRIRDLIMVQDKVMALNCLKPNTGKGIYNTGGATFCNHAVYLTVQAVDANYKEFIGKTNSYYGDRVLYNGDTPPDDFKKLDTNFQAELGQYNYRISNLWCDILKKQAENGILVKLNKENEKHEVGEKKAQEYANMGYVVVAAWKNEKPGKDNAPHFATVRPGYKYNPEKGPILANVGGTNGIRDVNKGFVDVPRENINWYYNPNQNFRDNVKKYFEDMLDKLGKNSKRAIV